MHSPWKHNSLTTQLESSTINSTASQKVMSEVESRITVLETWTQEILKKLCDMTSQLENNRQNPSSLRNQENHRQQKVCRFHIKFGNSSHKCQQPCDFPRKVTISKPSNNSKLLNSISSNNEKRLHILDKSNNIKFLIDSGSVVSVLPKSHILSKNIQSDDNIQLFAANGSLISTYGTKQLHVDLGLRRPYTWIFIIANVQSAIIGADLLHHHALLLENQPD